MTEVFNYHALFVNSTTTAFISRLDIDVKTEETLNQAAEELKAWLKPVLQNLAEQQGVKPPHSVPRFRLQGSSVYKTQNIPAHIPHQQVDLDLGVYISASFMENISAQNPLSRTPAANLAKIYFSIIDAQLRKLCIKRKWRYAEGCKQKDRCCHIELVTMDVHAHIDVPLYVAPNREFEDELVDKNLTTMKIGKALACADVSPELDYWGWEALEIVVIACRDGTWAESDVQKANSHFQNALAASGNPTVMLRIWRFVKAWRDHTWKLGEGPSSILLMEIVRRVFAEVYRNGSSPLDSDRDDKVLRHIFTCMSHHLTRNVLVKWGRMAEDLNRERTQEERNAWAAEAARAARLLERAACDKTLNLDQVILLVRTVFGQRIPGDVTLIKSLN